jgi:hypothetical protein
VSTDIINPKPNSESSCSRPSELHPANTYADQKSPDLPLLSGVLIGDTGHEKEQRVSCQRQHERGAIALDAWVGERTQHSHREPGRLDHAHELLENKQH